MGVAMRRQERQLMNTTDIQEILDGCQVCRIGLQDQHGMFIVPLNFGYLKSADGKTLTLYFHSAGAGRKIEALKANPAACFEMDCHLQLKEGDSACRYSYYFSSLMGTGAVSFVEAWDEKKEALSNIMKHQTGKDFEFDDQMASGVTVFKLVSTDFTGKSNIPRE